MIHPASDKFLALSVVAGEALEQGSVLRFTNLNDGTGRMQAFIATATTDVSVFGTFLAYYISPDSEDVEFVGAPQSTTFTLNTDTGVGGGTHTIASGTECVALGGSKVTLIRMDKNSLYDTPATLVSYTPGVNLKLNTNGRICLDANDDIDVVTAKVVQNDGASIVVLLS
jgi:hypothetical protein